MVVGFHCGATRSLIGWERSGVFWVHGVGCLGWTGQVCRWEPGKVSQGSGQQVCFAGEVFVGAHQGVAFLCQQKSVVHNWWTEVCCFLFNRRTVDYFSTKRSGISRSTQ